MSSKGLFVGEFRGQLYRARRIAAWYRFDDLALADGRKTLEFGELAKHAVALSQDEIVQELRECGREYRLITGEEALAVWDRMYEERHGADRGYVEDLRDRWRAWTTSSVGVQLATAFISSPKPHGGTIDAVIDDVSVDTPPYRQTVYPTSHALGVADCRFTDAAFRTGNALHVADRLCWLTGRRIRIRAESEEVHSALRRERRYPLAFRAYSNDEMAICIDGANPFYAAPLVREIKSI